MVSSRQPSLGSLGNVCGVQTDDIFHQPGYWADSQRKWENRPICIPSSTYFVVTGSLFCGSGFKLPSVWDSFWGKLGPLILTDFRARSFHLQSSPPAEATAGSAKTSPSAYSSGEFSGKPWLSDWLILLLIKRFSACERGWPNLGNSKSIVASPPFRLHHQTHLSLIWESPSISDVLFFFFLASLGINYKPC